jgi:hypothetical protein
VERDGEGAADDDEEYELNTEDEEESNPEEANAGLANQVNPAMHAATAISDEDLTVI